MRRATETLCTLLAGALAWSVPGSVQAAERKPGEYALTADSLPQAGVPRGKLEGPFLFRSRIIANTARRYWIYVPDQDDGTKDTNLLVCEDGARAVNAEG